MSSFEVSMIGAGSRPKLFGGKPTKGETWGTVVDPNRIVHGQCPKIDVTVLGPMNHKMDQIGMSHPTECTNGTFCNTILMFGTGSTKVKLLILTVTMFSKLMRAEDAIV
jgi:hypothetical protein